jgi:hypothetical protein
VNSLVVEQNIMRALPSRILTTKILQEIDEEVIESIAGEKLENAKKRKALETDIETLREVLQVVKEHHSASYHVTHG